MVSGVCGQFDSLTTKSSVRVSKKTDGLEKCRRRLGCAVQCCILSTEKQPQCQPWSKTLECRCHCTNLCILQNVLQSEPIFILQKGSPVQQDHLLPEALLIEHSVCPNWAQLTSGGMPRSQACSHSDDLALQQIETTVNAIATNSVT